MYRVINFPKKKQNNGRTLTIYIYIYLFIFMIFKDKNHVKAQKILFRILIISIKTNSVLEPNSCSPLFHRIN